MSKQFAPLAQAQAADPTKVAAPRPAFSAGDHVDPGDVPDHSAMDTKGDAAATDAQSPDAVRRKKIDWKNMIQQSLNGGQDTGDEDPMSILAMHNANQNAYLNPKTY